MPTGSLNPAVIEPISTTVYASPPTAASPPMGRVTSQPQTPEIIQSAPITTPPEDITQIYPQPPAQPVVALPDISKMTTDLLTGGQLLSDLPIAGDQPTSESSQAAADEAAQAQDPILSSVRLAKTPVMTETYTHTKEWGLDSDTLKKAMIILTTLTLLVIGASIWSSLRANNSSSSDAVNSQMPRVFQSDTVPADTISQ